MKPKIVIVIESNKFEPKVHGIFDSEGEAEKFFVENIAKDWTEKNWYDKNVFYVELAISNQMKKWDELQQEYR